MTHKIRIATFALFMTAAAALIVTASLAVTGCGARTMGATFNDNNDNLNNFNTNLNVNVNNNNVVDPPVTEFLTRRIMYQQTVNEPMGFQLDLGQDCPAASYYEDVGVEGFDEYLCWTLYFTVMLNVDPSSGVPNYFMPERHVTHGEMWDTLLELVGFYPYNDADCNVMDDPEFGSLCERGLLSSVSESDELVTLHQWYETLHNLRLYMQQQATRLAAYEVLMMTFQRSPMFYNIVNCDPTYEDLEPDSFECHISYQANVLGLSDPGQQNFRPEDAIMWVEAFKLAADAADINLAPSECSDLCDGTEWYCDYVNIWCLMGVLPEGLTREDLASQPSMGDLANFFYNAAVVTDLQHP